MLRDLIALPDHSKVWIYQADRPFDDNSKELVRADIREFIDQWNSHSVPVESYGNLFHQQFIVLVANEEGHGVSGCSIDSSVQLIRALGEKYNMDFFNRNTFAYMTEKEEIKTIDKDSLPDLHQSGEINSSTLFFDNLVSNKKQFLEKWVIPLENSWHSRFL